MPQVFGSCEPMHEIPESAKNGQVRVSDPGGAKASSCYDVLVLDAGCKQSLASVRSLGRRGLRVALGESVSECRPLYQPPSFRSRYCAEPLVLPDYTDDVPGYQDAVIDFVSQNPTRVVLPTSDASISAVGPLRERLAELGCVLALAPDRALQITGDKERTLAIAGELGIAYPKSIRISEMDDLKKAIAEFGFPLVIKPAISWAGQPATRIIPVEVVNEEEAKRVVARFLAMRAGVLAQQWACGQREGVSLFIVNGKVVAKCGHVAYRTNPAMGGVSVMRESIPVPPDILDPAVRLSTAVGMEGVCEVEFRRDADNRPLLMEINPRLAGTIENAIRSGVDFPLMIWQWATGGPVRVVNDYRTGVRTRWLQGDLRWLMENQRHAGRPDTVSRIRSFWIFAAEFARTRYYDYLDWNDVKPAVAEFRCTMAGSWRVLARK